MKDHQIRAWLQIVETGSIRSAARSLHLSQAAVTKAIRELEAELDAPLLIRSSRGISLTEFGKRITPRLQLAQKQVEIAIDDVRQLRGGANTHVGFAVMPLIFLTVLPKVLADFKRQMPLVRLSAREGLMNAIIPALRDGSVDFAIGAATPQLLPSDLVIEPWQKLEMVIVGRKNHPMREEISWDRVSESEWLVHPAPSSPSSQFLTMLGEKDLPVPRRRIAVDTFGVSWSLVSGGDALLLCPRAMLSIPHYGNQVDRIPLAMDIPSLTLGLIRLRDVPLSFASEKLAAIFKSAVESVIFE